MSVSGRRLEPATVFALAALCGVLALCGRADGQANDAPVEAAGPLVRVGEVDGRTFNEHRSSFDARGTAFVTADGNAVRVWDAQTFKPLTEPLAHANLEAFVISGDGRTVLTRDKAEARLWDVATSAVRCVIRPGRGELRFAEIGPDGSRVVTVDAGDPLYVNLWHAAEAEPRLEKQLTHAGRGWVESAQFDPSGTRIVSYRSSTGTFITHNPDDIPKVGAWGKTNKQYYYPYVAKLDPRGGQYAIPTWQDLVIVDYERRRTITSRYANGAVYPHGIFFSADGSRISIVTDFPGGDGECQVYDGDSGRFQRAFARGMEVCRLFGPGGGLAICARRPSDKPSGPAELWDVDAGKLLQRIAEDSLREASPDGRTVLFDTPANRTSVWRLRD